MDVVNVEFWLGASSCPCDHCAMFCCTVPDGGVNIMSMVCTFYVLYSMLKQRMLCGFVQKRLQVNLN